MSNEMSIDCGSYEKNRNMAEHINSMSSSGNPSSVNCGNGKIYIDMDSLSRETSETQRAVLDIVSTYED